MRTALEVLFRSGNPPYYHDERARILSKPFQFVKTKKAEKKIALDILGHHEAYVFPQEGYKYVYAVGPLDMANGGNLPRIIWVKVKPGVYGGWARTRKNQQAYKEYREFMVGVPGSPILKGKTA